MRAMVVADSPVALDNASLQAPAKGTIVMAGALRVSFQSLGHGEPLEWNDAGSEVSHAPDQACRGGGVGACWMRWS